MPGCSVPLKVNHQGNESVIDDATTALIGSDATSTIRIVRPGISRRHAVISHDDTGWRIEDAGSRNGTFLNGQRIQVLAIEQPVTLYLGHPSDGESVSLTPVVADVSSSKRGPKPTDAGEPEAFDLPPMPPAAAVAAGSAVARTEVQPRQQKPAPAKERRATAAPSAASASDVEVAQLTAAIRDQISAIKGLTWSVWAMIAATAALIVLTLFVGILSN
jgi:hypothetical protein